jgi:hypothetical protein
VTTGYYVSTPSCKDACEHCSESKTIHLGQTAAGWRFLFHAYDADNQYDVPEVKDLPTWLALAASGPVKDEYGRTLGLDELLQLILHRQKGVEFRTREASGSRNFDDAYGFHFARGEWS